MDYLPIFAPGMEDLKDMCRVYDSEQRLAVPCTYTLPPL